MTGDLFGNDFTMPIDANTDPLACAAPPKAKSDFTKPVLVENCLETQPRPSSTVRGGVIKPQFDGKTYDEQRDSKRLTSQLQAVKKILSDHKPHTLYEVVERVRELTGKRASESGVSARIRDLRKEKFGGHTIEDIKPTPDAPGVWHYRMKESA